MYGYVSFLTDAAVILAALVSAVTGSVIIYIWKTQNEREARLNAREARLQQSQTSSGSNGGSVPSAVSDYARNHSPVPDDRKAARIRELAAEGRSVTAIARAVHGHANKFYNDKVREVLAASDNDSDNERS
jgi:hypothetical protein